MDPPSEKPPTIASRRDAVQALLALACSLSYRGAHASAPELRAIVADDGAASAQIVAALRRVFPRLPASRDMASLRGRPGAAIYVAIGPAALELGLSTGLDAPIVALFTSRQRYALMASGRPFTASAPLTAIYAEPAPMQQMQVIERLYGRRIAVGMVLSSATAALEPAFRQAATQCNLELMIEGAQTESQLAQAHRELAHAAVFLAIPDKDLYTSDSFHAILASSYRRGQPVIGFSPALVGAGALAAPHSTVEDVVAQLDEVLSAVASGRAFPPAYPRFWRVAINDSVARSLNLVIEPGLRRLGTQPSTGGSR